jgi:uncharacterized protein YndB with AHSA1/START domain
VNDAPPIRHEVRIEAPLELVRRFLVEPARMTQWLSTKAEIDPRPHGKIRLEFARPDGTIDVATGEIVEVSARRLVFTWGFAGNPDLPPGASRVEISLQPDGAGTLVRLEHHGLPTSQREPHDGGWRFFLDRLRDSAVAEARPT